MIQQRTFKKKKFYSNLQDSTGINLQNPGKIINSDVKTRTRILE